VTVAAQVYQQQTRKDTAAAIGGTNNSIRKEDTSKEGGGRLERRRGGGRSPKPARGLSKKIAAPLNQTKEEATALNEQPRREAAPLDSKGKTDPR
jgi:hypothetical protein